MKQIFYKIQKNVFTKSSFEFKKNLNSKKNLPFLEIFFEKQMSANTPIKGV